MRRPKNAPLARNPTLAKTNLLNCPHLPLIPSAFPLSTRNSGRMQAYSEEVKRRPGAWKIALPSRVLSACRCSQAICSARRRRRDPRIGQRYVRDMLDIVMIFARRKCASAALRRGRAPARCLSRPQSLPKREGLLSARTPASNPSAAALRPLRPCRNSESLRTFLYRRSTTVFETHCTTGAIQKSSPRRGHPRSDRH